MKHDCNVARDLMPLCIDGAASEESQQYVDEHVAECGECADFFAQIRAELPTNVDTQEQEELNAAAKKVKHRRIRRALIGAALGILVGVLTFLIVSNYDELKFRAKYVHLNGDLKFDAVYAEVYMQRNGYWTVALNSIQSGKPCYETDLEIIDTDDGKGVYVQFRFAYRGFDSEEWDCASTCLIGNAGDEVWTLTVDDGVKLPILWVEVVSGNETRVIWRQGDTPKTQDEVQDYLAQFGYH